ncbi:MAG: hypothetical protein NTW14_10835 [bacterium]|nr:hypothetical protein [bacterium]
MDMKKVLDKAKDLHDQAKEAGKDTLQSALDASLEELQGLRPILAKCGFSINNISITISIPPNVVLTIKHDREEAMGLAEMEKSTELTKMQSLVVKSLKNTYEYSGMFEKYGYVIGTISVTVTIIPKITISLVTISGK